MLPHKSKEKLRTFFLIFVFGKGGQIWQCSCLTPASVLGDYSGKSGDRVGKGII